MDRIGPVRGLRILGVGCGDGVLATKLAAAIAQVTGLDASAETLATARHLADAAGVDLDLVEGAADKLPFPDVRFDVVISTATLCFSADPRLSIGQMVRVLKPGGRLIPGELGRWNSRAALRRIIGWLGSSPPSTTRSGRSPPSALLFLYRARTKRYRQNDADGKACRSDGYDSYFSV